MVERNGLPLWPNFALRSTYEIPFVIMIGAAFVCALGEIFKFSSAALFKLSFKSDLNLVKFNGMFYSSSGGIGSSGDGAFEGPAGVM